MAALRRALRPPGGHLLQLPADHEGPARRPRADRVPGLVRHRRWMTYLITTFSNRYFEAFRDYRRGRPVADAWRLTFEAAASGDANAGQDVLLFSNAHVQHDLPFALEEMGLRARSGASHKPDHDAVNAINAARLRPDREVHRGALRPELRALRPAGPGRGAGRPRAGQALARGRVAQRRAPAERRQPRRAARGRRADPGDLAALGAADLRRRPARHPRGARLVLPGATGGPMTVTVAVGISDDFDTVVRLRRGGGERPRGSRRGRLRPVPGVRRRPAPGARRRDPRRRPRAARAPRPDRLRRRGCGRRRARDRGGCRGGRLGALGPGRDDRAAGAHHRARRRRHRARRAARELGRATARRCWSWPTRTRSRPTRSCSI